MTILMTVFRLKRSKKKKEINLNNQNKKLTCQNVCNTNVVPKLLAVTTLCEPILVANKSLIFWSDVYFGRNKCFFEYLNLIKSNGS